MLSLKTLLIRKKSWKTPHWGFNNWCSLDSLYCHDLGVCEMADSVTLNITMLISYAQLCVYGIKLNVSRPQRAKRTECMLAVVGEESYGI